MCEEAIRDSINTNIDINTILLFIDKGIINN